jgi:putative ABC transport system permease protein
MNVAALARLDSGRPSLGSDASGVLAVPVLYAVVTVRPANDSSASATSLVAAGANLAQLRLLNPAWKVSGQADDQQNCALGSHAAERLKLRPGGALTLSADESHTGISTGADQAGPSDCPIAGLVSTGGAEDDQVFVPLARLQRMERLDGRVSLIEMRIPGTAVDVEAAVRSLARAFPDLEVRPVREIVQSEGRVLTTLRSLILSLAAVIIGVVGLCVMATVTAIVLERRKEIAVMKALGASERTVFGLLLTEVGALGVAGGLVGFLIGALLARRLGLDLFGVALAVDWKTLPPVVAVAALAAAIPALVPVSSVRGVDPARALRGE